MVPTKSSCVVRLWDLKLANNVVGGARRAVDGARAVVPKSADRRRWRLSAFDGALEAVIPNYVQGRDAWIK